jgi:hypothetical protein
VGAQHILWKYDVELIGDEFLQTQNGIFLKGEVLEKELYSRHKKSYWM